MKFFKNKYGYTMVELLLFMALTGIFLTVSAQLLQSTVDYKLETEGSAAVDLSGNYLYRKLTYDLRRASAIITPSTPGQISDVLSLNINGQIHTYSLNSGRLILTMPSETLPLSDSMVNIRNFSITGTGINPQSPGVRINFEVDSIDKTSGDVGQSRNWQFSFVKR